MGGGQNLAAGSSQPRSYLGSPPGQCRRRNAAQRLLLSVARGPSKLPLGRKECVLVAVTVNRLPCLAARGAIICSSAAKCFLLSSLVSGILEGVE